MVNKKWHFTYATLQEEIDRVGGNCGGTSNVYQKTDKKIFGIPVSNAVCYMPNWRKHEEDSTVLENVRLIAAAPEMLNALMAVKDSVPDDLKQIVNDAINLATSAEPINKK